jgi:anti-sigma regulatory factor (Ser/Thr protein kinase)
MRIERAAVPETPAAMRHALTAFLVAMDVPKEARTDIVTAVGETLSNAVEHAYRDAPTGTVAMIARADAGDRLTVDVVDRGRFRAPADREFRGYGLRIVRKIATSVELTTASGTTIRMIFDISGSGEGPQPQSLSGT